MDIVGNKERNGLGQVQYVQSSVEGPIALNNNTVMESRQYSFPSR